MKELIKKVFYCDFCNKNYFQKSTCQKHEDVCANRPENRNPCLNGCKHLDRTTQEVYYVNTHGGYAYEENAFVANCFLCKKTDTAMFPHSAEWINKKYGLEANNQEPMPKVFCKDFEEYVLPF